MNIVGRLLKIFLRALAKSRSSERVPVRNCGGLKRAGVLSNLAGLLIGGMTDMNDNTIPFGKTAEEIIRETVDKYNYPVYFGFPAGHMNDNRALVMGREAKIIPKEKDTVSFVTL